MDQRTRKALLDLRSFCSRWSDRSPDGDGPLGDLARALDDLLAALAKYEPVLNDITAACRRYLSPLIAGEDYPPYVNGLPAYVTLRGRGVPKRLKTRFLP